MSSNSERQFIVNGMSCAACQARVEKAVAGLEGIDSCAVSLLTNSMSVKGTASDRKIIKAVSDAGYDARVKGDDEVSLDTGEAVLKKRLISSVILLLILMYFSMGHMMFGAPLPAALGDNLFALGCIQMILAAVIMFINRKFFTSGISSLLHGGPNMDTLVAMGSGVAFCWSVYILGKIALIGGASHDAADMTGDMMNGASETVGNAAMGLMNELYFETAAMIVTLITVGKLLEAISKGRTTDALKGLLELAPKTATVLCDPESPGTALTEKVIPVEEVKVGDLFVVKPGESIPVDGEIIEGTTAVDESALTGESVPVDKGAGDQVSAATINRTGYVRCRATRVGFDTTLSQIIKMVSDAATTKAPMARIADRVSGVFVPVVLVIAAVTAIIWIMVSHDVGYSLARGISVLVVSCPCALGLATPVAIMVGSGVGARNGILFKTSESLEMVGRAGTVAMDKTGTITWGQPEVTDIIPSDVDGNPDELLDLAYSLECLSEHPLAKAVVREWNRRAVLPTADKGQGSAGAVKEEPLEDNAGRSDYVPKITGFREMPGNGLYGILEGEAVLAGKESFVSGKEVPDAGVEAFDAGKVIIPEETSDTAKKLSEEGKTCLFFARGGEYKGLIAVADGLKEDSAGAVRALRDMGLETVMITGDREGTARTIAETCGITRVISQVLPGDKEAVVRKLSRTGRVIMVGDGINDAPALTSADVGVAIGAGTDVAIDAADTVLMDGSLTKVASAIKLGKATIRNIHQNLFWAFIYNILLIPLAAGAYVHLTGWTMDPMLGAAAMSLSSFCVVVNALRLNRVRIDVEDQPDRDTGSSVVPVPIYDTDKTIAETKGETTMQKTISIEGMMCKHCEATVKEALELIPAVAYADVSHEKGTAVVETSEDVSDEMLRHAVEEKDYVVKNIL